MYPTEVEINTKAIERLTRTLQDAYKSIYNEIATATDFGVANRKAILAQIHGKLTELGVDVQKFIETEIGNQYKIGANEAVKQLQNIGAGVNVAEGFNRVHMEAIKMLVDDTAKAFATSMTGVDRSAQLLLGKVSREALTQKLAEGIIGGKARKEINKIIKGTLQDQGLAALIDKGGHRWTLDRYADMLFRTKAVEARNRGLINRMVENEYDLVQVSNHSTDCELCGPWEGKILSATGATPGYETVADAEANGLFHPNCKHAINTLIPSLARQTRAYDQSTGGYGPPGKTIEPTGKAPRMAPKQTTTKITIGPGKRATTIEIKTWEENLAKERLLDIQGTGARSYRGLYSWTTNDTKNPKIEINTSRIYAKYGVDPKLYNKEVSRTLYHEMGHFIDHKYDTNPGWISERNTNNPVSQDAKQIVVKRLEHSFLGNVPGGNEWSQKYGLKPEDLKTLADGRQIVLKEATTGRTIEYKLSRTNLKYYNSPSEVFADGYAQYRTDPAEFKKYAPKAYEYFEALGGDKP